MKNFYTFALVGCVALSAACGDDDSTTNNAANNAANNTTNNSTNGTANNTTNNVVNNGSNNADGSAEAQLLGADLFNAVYLAVQVNAQKNASEFATSGMEGLVDCTDLFTTTSYGQATFTFEAGSGPYMFAATVMMDGCLAVQSGTNAPFEFEQQDASGDDIADTTLMNGKLAAITFDEEGLPPAVADYDANAAPTCTDIVVSNIFLETIGLLPDGSGFSNETEPHNPNGKYTEGTLTANCGGKKLLCDLNGGTRAPVLINLDAVASSKGLDSICVFE